MRRLLICRGWKLGKNNKLLGNEGLDPLEEKTEEDCDILRTRHARVLQGTGFDGRGPPEKEQEVTIYDIVYENEPFPEELSSNPFDIFLGEVICYGFLIIMVLYFIFSLYICPYCKKRLDEYREEKKKRLLEEKLGVIIKEPPGRRKRNFRGRKQVMVGLLSPRAGKISS